VDRAVELAFVDLGLKDVDQFLKTLLDGECLEKILFFFDRNSQM